MSASSIKTGVNDNLDLPAGNYLEVGRLRTEWLRCQRRGATCLDLVAMAVRLGADGYDQRPQPRLRRHVPGLPCDDALVCPSRRRQTTVEGHASAGVVE